MWMVRFKVKFTPPFPMDMLRYDTCHPVSMEDAAKMDNELRQPEIVELEHRAMTKAWTPSVDRWKSFMCQVVSKDRPKKM
jgi:hypothetical protein